MRTKIKVNTGLLVAILALGWLLAACPARGATLYVNAASAAPAAPYDTWDNAAKVIQDAIDAASSGDEIVVTNGVYATGGRLLYGLTTNRVAVVGPITLRSVNGPQVTIIRGAQVPGTTNGATALRGVYLTDGAVLSGFTVTNGATAVGEPGGGVFCDSTAGIVTNCIITGNAADSAGGGAESGTLYNCTLNNNTAPTGGGASDGALIGCTLAGNKAVEGGGAYSASLTNCTLRSNLAGYGGGASGSTLQQCVVSTNSAGDGAGAYYCSVYNSAFSGNASTGEGGGSYDGMLINCTVTGNSSATSGGGSAYGTLENCIIYYNTAPAGGANVWGGSATLNYCCTTPMPTNGVGHITNAPLFINSLAGNLRLQTNSPCINVGSNALVSGTADLDGRPRIVSSKVDLGAYEFQPGVSGVFIAWLAQYGLPTDGSADYTDPDHDGLNDWQEWVCQTNPTNALSALGLVAVAPVGTKTTLTWQSVAGVNYYLQWRTNLAAASPFVLLATNLAGQSGFTSYTQTSAVHLPRQFYRVGVPVP